MVEEVIIRPAKIEDIPGILEIQNDFLLKNKSIKAAEKEGFLVYSIKEDELKNMISSGNLFLFVAVSNGKVIGYASACSLEDWRKSKVKWDKRIIVSPKIRDHLYTDRIIYLRHIARNLNYPGVGAQLEEKIYAIAKEKGFKFVVGEILELPLSNEKSRKIHEERGYVKIGQANYLDGNFWGIYEKELD